MKLTSLFLSAPLFALVAACSAAPTETPAREPAANEGQALTPPESGDDPIFRDPCAQKDCPAKTHCSAPADAPICVPDDIDPTDPGPGFPRDPCANKHCPTGTHCTAPADAPMCVRNTPTNPCAAVFCPPTKRCVVQGDRGVCKPFTY